MDENAEGKQSEDMLETNGGLFKAQFENSPDIILLIDRNYKVMAINHIPEGPYTNIGVVGRDAIQILPSSAREDARRAVSECFESGEIQEFEHQLSGDRWFHSRIVPLKTEGAVRSVMVISTDITERKKAEKDLRTEKEFTSTIFNAIPDVVYVLDAARGGQFIRWNKAVERLSGYTAEEMANKKIFDFFQGEDLERQEAFFQALMQKGEAVIEANAVIKDGSLIPFQAYATLIRDDDGNPLYVCGVGRDITARRKAEEDIRRSAEEWERTFNSITDMVSIQDKNFKLLRVNKAYADALGMKPEDVVGRNCYEVIHGLSEPWHKCPHKETLRTLKPAVKEFYEPKLEKYVEASTSPYFDNKGEVAGTVHIIKDITSRRKTEKELRLTHDIIQTMSEGVYLIGYEDAIIKYANPKFEKMFGYEPGEIIGKHVSVVNATDGKSPKQTANEIIESIVKTGEWHGEVYNIKKDGTPFWGYANVSVTEHPDLGKVMISVHTDITDRKKAEEDAILKSQLLDLASDSVFIYDQDGVMTYVNQTAFKTRGYTREELMKLNLKDIYTPEDSEKIPPRIKEMMDGGELAFETAHLRKDGTAMQVEVHAKKINMEGRKLIFSVARDITQRKRIENELKERLSELERFQKVAVGRELRMRELKDELRKLKKTDTEGGLQKPS
jgi:PAS domain S-box-containing protein